jgi:hypothetical protein
MDLFGNPKVSWRVLRSLSLLRNKMKERRRFPRYEVSIPCVVEWHHYSVTGQIIDLSLGGALIDCPTTLPPPGALVMVEFRHHKVRIGKAISRVVWVPELGRVGVQFEDAESIMPKLIDFLEQRRRQHYLKAP